MTDPGTDQERRGIIVRCRIGRFFIACRGAGEERAHDRHIPEAWPKSANYATWSPETLLVHGGTLRSQFGETSEAMFLTQSFVYDSAEQAEARFKDEDPGFIYSRFSNPTMGMFEERMRLLEGAEAARATATGMAAVTSALLCFLKAGDHIVAARAMFGSCLYVAQELCPRFGIACTLVDGRDTAAWQRAMQPNTRAFFFETPANPTLDLVDIAAVSEIAHAGGALVIVDNVFATPLMQKPLKLGADIVVYSATKHIDGQGRCLGGVDAVLAEVPQGSPAHLPAPDRPGAQPVQCLGAAQGPGDVAAARARAMPRRRRRSPTISPRSRASGCSTAAAPTIRRRRSPGGRCPVSARSSRSRSQGGKAAAFRFLNALKLIRISNNLGDAKSLITHPATTTHQRLKPEARAELGISDGMLRLSVGLEAYADLAADIDRALAASRIG